MARIESTRRVRRGESEATRCRIQRARAAKALFEKRATDASAMVVAMHHAPAHNDLITDEPVSAAAPELADSIRRDEIPPTRCSEERFEVFAFVGREVLRDIRVEDREAGALHGRRVGVQLEPAHACSVPAALREQSIDFARSATNQDRIVRAEQQESRLPNTWALGGCTGLRTVRTAAAHGRWSRFFLMRSGTLCMPVLVLSRRYSDDANAMCRAAVTAGGDIVGATSYGVPAELEGRSDVVFYAETLVADALLEPGVRWLAELPERHVRRSVRARTLDALNHPRPTIRPCTARRRPRTTSKPRSSTSDDEWTDS
jgi:hypothetical protein